LPCSASATTRDEVAPSGTDTTASRKPGTANVTSGVGSCRGASGDGDGAAELGTAAGNAKLEALAGSCVCGRVELDADADAGGAGDVCGARHAP